MDHNNTINMDSLEVLIPIVMCAMIFGIVYVTVTARHRQRMAMIEKGADPSLFASKSNGSLALAFGLLMIGIGLGVFLGWIADRIIFQENWGDSPGPYLIGVLVCGGAALLQYHRIV